MAMKFTMKTSESKYGAPLGLYVAKFVGVQEKNHPEYGAGYEWQFEIIEGPQAGKIVSRSTGVDASPKNGCGRMISDLLGGLVQIGQEVDIERCVGLRYKVKVEPNSTNTGTRVGSATLMDEMPAQTAAPATTAAQRPAQTPAQTAAPATQEPFRVPTPPRRGGTPAPLRQARKFWVQKSPEDDCLPQPMSDDAIQTMLIDEGLDVKVVQLMPEDQSADWKPASECGFDGGAF